MISEDVKLDYDDVLIVPDKSPIASRKQVDLEKRVAFGERAGAEFIGVPIMAANMDGVGTTAMADALRRHGIFTCLTKFHTAAELAEFFNGTSERGDFTAATIGISDEDLQKFVDAENRAKGRIKYACLDVANGYTNRFLNRVKKFRAMFPKVVVIAGNVVTHEQTTRLIEAGADIVKVGIGGGSVCETRVKTGGGYRLPSILGDTGMRAFGSPDRQGHRRRRRLHGTRRCRQSPRRRRRLRHARRHASGASRRRRDRDFEILPYR